MTKPFDRQAPIAWEALSTYVSAIKFGNSYTHLIGSTNMGGKTLCGKQPKMKPTYVAETVTCRDCCARYRDGQHI